MGACILQANQESTAAGKNRVAAVDGEKRVTQNEMFILNVAQKFSPKIWQIQEVSNDISR